MQLFYHRFATINNIKAWLQLLVGHATATEVVDAGGGRAVRFGDIGDAGGVEAHGLDVGGAQHEVGIAGGIGIEGDDVVARLGDVELERLEGDACKLVGHVVANVDVGRIGG